MLTEGGRSPTGVSKTGRPPAPAVSGSETSNPKQTLGCGWNAAGTASFEPASLHRNKSSNGCRTVLGRFCDFALLYRCARVLQDGLSYDQYEVDCKAHPTDEYALSLMNV